MTVLHVGRRTPPQWRVVLKNPKVIGGLVLLVLFLVAIVAQPVLQNTVWERRPSTYNPLTGYDTEVVHPSSPSATHWLGTDSLGRDVVSMFTHSAGPSVTVALAAAAAVAFVSLALGSVAAYRRGLVDGFISHLSDAMVLLPALLAVYVLGVGRPDEEFGALHVGLTFGLIYGLG
ncbi:MAG: hypothetical protein ACRDVD_05455, partial [Acidimicrobiia bacterium]